jgi:GNAT superfamily N-acetyltransferase
MSDLSVHRADIQSPAARRLIEALNAELSAIYPEQSTTHFRLDPAEVSTGLGAFVIASVAELPVGCGAVRRIGDGVGEIKRMYVVPSARGRGIGRALLTALEEEARPLGLSRLVLETGARQHAAMAMYERAGFSRVPAYGEYVRSPLSVCMSKDLHM